MPIILKEFAEKILDYLIENNLEWTILLLGIFLILFVTLAYILKW
jgi:hypothetical protein